MQLRRECPISQCINELSSNLQVKRYSEPPRTENLEDKSPKEKESENNKNGETSGSDNDTEKISKSHSDLLAKPSHFVTVIEVKEPSSPSNTANSNSNSSSATAGVTSTTSSFKSIRSGYENVIIENNKRNSIEPLEPKMQNSSFTNYNKDLGGKPTTAKSAAIALLQDAKKKIPPR